MNTVILVYKKPKKKKTKKKGQISLRVVLAGWMCESLLKPKGYRPYEPIFNLSSTHLQLLFFSPWLFFFCQNKKPNTPKNQKNRGYFQFSFFLCGKFQEPACFPPGFQRVMAGVARFKTRRKAAQNRSSGNLSFATMAANLFCTLQKIAKYTV